MEQKGRLEAKRLMKMSAKQLYFLRALEMDEAEFESEALKKSEENPFLHVKRERRERDFSFSEPSSKDKDFSSFEDKGESLYSVLLSQLNCTKISDLQRKMCAELIYNLDESGFHILSPENAAQKFLPHFKNEASFENAVEKCLSFLRTFEPHGVFSKDVFESLLLQAKAKNASPLCIFFLSGHLSFISPPSLQKVKEKLRLYIEEKSATFALSEKEQKELEELKKLSTDEKIAAAIKEIQLLNPHPAAEYETEKKMTRYIEADLFLAFHKGSGREDLDAGLVAGREGVFEISFTNRFEVSVSKENYDATLKRLYNEATSFAALLSERRALVLRVVAVLVKKQLDFFESGKPLKPFTQRELASFLGIHYSLVSRALSGKRLESARGVFSLSSFFPRGILNEKLKRKVGIEKVQSEISSLINESERSGKVLSDQKICGILNLKGYKIARRTVAKWRGKMGIGSSFFRRKNKK